MSNDAAVRDAEFLLKRTLQVRHADRANYDPLVFDHALLLEIDRALLYVAVNGRWCFLSGCVTAMTVEDVPTDLTDRDAGVNVLLLDMGHRLFWDGHVWQFAPGDAGNGYLQAMPIVDLGVDVSKTWAFADGSVATYLVVGEPRLRFGSVTLPNAPGMRFRR
jgi:hypothetical protein